MRCTLPGDSVLFLVGEYPARVIWMHGQPDTVQPPHPLWSIVFVTEGSAIHHIGDNVYPIRIGDAFVINNKERHSYSEIENLQTANVQFDFQKLKVKQWQTHQLHGYQAMFHSTQAHDHTGAMNGHLHLDKISFRNSIALVQEIDKCIREKFPCWQMLVDVHFRHLVLLLSRAYDGHLRTHDEAPERMNGVIAFLNKNFQQTIDFDVLAKNAGMSQRTFYRLFKQATGYPPLTYVINCRIQYACTLLRNTTHPITQIAFDAGFSDSNYFAREFRKVIGENPTDYRGRWAN
ncbi:MAG: helix-turn-helix domain-containing protein [Chthoniobacteraceae bacterium]